MFHPGETDVHVFILPFPADDVGGAVISYKQNDRVIL